MQHIIYTWGSGEVLESLFNAIATLINGKTGSLYHSLIRLGLMVGLLSAVLSSLQGNLLHGLMRWFLPVYVTITLLFAPTTKVLIRDQATGGIHKVDNVPWGLGAFAGLASSVSYNMTENIEKVFSLPDDLKYHQTGAMLASNLIASARTFHMVNTEVAETFKDFVSQCVVYDVLLGTKYTMDDLKNSANIWELVKTNASPARAFTYRGPGKGGRGEIVICKDGIEKLGELLEGQVASAFDYFGTRSYGHNNDNYKLGSSLLKAYMPVSYNYMAKMSGEAEDLMQQQLMIYTTIDAIDSKATELGNAPNFALRRAYLQQRANQENVAGLAQKTMLAMKNVMEALIYAAFMFVLPLAMLPKGWRFIGNWAGKVLWVQMWAPLYAILNFIMNVSAKSKGIGSITTAGGITIANSVGFSDLHADMAAQAGYLSLSVGALGYALVKGGASSFMNMVGHLTNPMVSAAGRATEDMLSGNYSFGNVNLGNVQASNMSFGQQMFSPSHTSGSINQNDGVMASTTTADGTRILNVGNSNLRSNIQTTKLASSSLSEQANQTATAQYSTAKSYAISDMKEKRAGLDYIEHKAQNQNYGNGVSKAEQSAANESFTKVDNAITKLADDHKISKDHAKELVGKASVSFNTKDFAVSKLTGISGGVDGSRQTSARKSESAAFSAAQELTNNAGFQDAYQKSIQYSQNEQFNENDEKGKRLSESISTSQAESRQLREEFNAQSQKISSYSDAANWLNQNSVQITSNENQKYVDWLSRQVGRHAADKILASDFEADQFYQAQFMAPSAENLKQQALSHVAGSVDKVQNAYTSYANKIPDLPNDSFQDQVKSKARAAGFDEQYDSTLDHNAMLLNQEALNHSANTDQQISDKRHADITEAFKNMKAAKIMTQDDPLDEVSIFGGWENQGLQQSIAKMSSKSNDLPETPTTSFFEKQDSELDNEAPVLKQQPANHNSSYDQHVTDKPQIDKIELQGMRVVEIITQDNSSNEGLPIDQSKVSEMMQSVQDTKIQLDDLQEAQQNSSSSKVDVKRLGIKR